MSELFTSSGFIDHGLFPGEDGRADDWVQWSELDIETNDEWTVLDPFGEDRMSIIHCPMFGGAEWECEALPGNWALVVVYSGTSTGRSEQEPT